MLAPPPAVIFPVRINTTKGGSIPRHVYPGVHAARQRTADFYYTRKQNVSWLGYMCSKGAVSWAER